MVRCSRIGPFFEASMKTILRLFDNAILAIIFLCILGFVVFAFLQVTSRFAFNFSIAWTEELCRYLFVWMVFLGAGVGVLRRKHIAVDIVPNLIPTRMRKYYNVFLDLLIVVFCILLIRYGAAFSAKAMQQRSPAMQIPLGYIYYGIIAGGAVMLINAIRSMLSSFLALPTVETGAELQPEMSQEEFNRLLGLETGKGGDTNA